MNIQVRKYYPFLVLLAFIFTCKKPYNPPAIQAANNYLVVDGFINANTNEATRFIISRTKKLTDTTSENIAELKAQVSIISDQGDQYSLSDSNNSGIYNSTLLTLNANKQYQLKITTSDGHQYVSDFVHVKKSAPIDSITWEQNNDVSIYVNTHDPTNSTVYYKWDFVETWQYQAPLIRYWVVVNGMITSMDSTNQTFTCWSTNNSKTIITATSAALNQDVISRAPLTKILQNDIKIKIRYSILVRQIPLTLDAYNYWILIQKNSQQLGTLFDPQPSQLTGNIHPVTVPNEPVIGYVTAATTQQKRLFIDHSQLNNWSTIVDHRECLDTIIAQNPTNFLIYDFPDPTYAFYYFVGSNPFGLFLTLTECVDCRVKGGVNTKPAFW